MDEKACRDIISWLILIRAPALSCRASLKLLQQFLHPDKIITANSRLLKSVGLDDRSISYFKHPDKRQLELDLAWLEDKDHYFIHLHHPQYPDLLKQISDPPLALFAQGNLSCLSKVSIGVFGSRKPTSAGHIIA